jgi:hypothetical protein
LSRAAYTLLLQLRLLQLSRSTAHYPSIYAVPRMANEAD